MMNNFSNDEIRALADRVSQLEQRVTDLEKRYVIQTPLPSSSSTTDKVDIPKIVSIELVQKAFHEANYNLGDSGDRIDFVFRFKNLTSKDIRAFEGIVIFCDLFNRVILRIDLTNEEKVLAGKTVEWRGGIEYNQFLSEHQRLLSINMKDLSVDFLMRNVIYTDGTRESYEDIQ